MSDRITTTNGMTMTNAVIECVLSRSAARYSSLEQMRLHRSKAARAK